MYQGPTVGLCRAITTQKHECLLNHRLQKNLDYPLMILWWMNQGSNAKKAGLKIISNPPSREYEDFFCKKWREWLGAREKDVTRTTLLPVSFLLLQNHAHLLLEKWIFSLRTRFRTFLWAFQARIDFHKRIDLLRSYCRGTCRNPGNGAPYSRRYRHQSRWTRPVLERRQHGIHFLGFERSR